MSNDIKAVEFVAEVRPVKQMADGTVNITYNVPEYCAEQAKLHIDWHGSMVRVVAEVIAEDDKNTRNHKEIHI